MRHPKVNSSAERADCALHYQAGQRKKRLRPVFAWVLLCVLSIVVIFIIAAWTLMFRTNYADGFSRTKFYSINVGEPIESVVERVGDPLSVAILPIPPDATGDFWVDFIALEDAVDLAQRPGVERIGFRYSEPIDDSSSYRVYEVWFENGVVVEVRKSWYVD